MRLGPGAGRVHDRAGGPAPLARVHDQQVALLGSTAVDPHRPQHGQAVLALVAAEVRRHHDVGAPVRPASAGGPQSGSAAMPCTSCMV